MLISQSVLEKLTAYLNQAISLSELANWSENTLMEPDYRSVAR